MIDSPRLSIIVAMARNRVIGASGAIPWHLPGELKRFRNITMGHHIIMGRKTWESIGRTLPGRTSVIITRNSGYRAPGALVTHSLDEAISACRGDEEIFVIGGAELYAQALPRASRLYLTVVEADVEGDTWMPELDAGIWRETASQSFAADERHAYPYRCSIHERVRD
ncbi:MAG: dihydrofolate reductase [Betaproteobacteria bacterium]|nr:dihydrofolate reductase [Betaproteobacteria bacterium]MDH3436285.1 dihydrofolate reductase [Betaproteobacteria bacterium]